jgi:hypothetical protein
VQLLARVHTWTTIALVALVPLVPLGLFLYAHAAGVDRAWAVAANERVFRSLHHPAGARVIGTHVYAMPRWGNEGSLVPTVGYRSEFLIRLPHAVPQRVVLAAYRQARGNGATIDVQLFDLSSGRARTYGVYVSQ